MKNPPIRKGGEDESNVSTRPKRVIKKRKKKEKPKRIYTCVYCKKKITDQSSWVSHMETHSTEYPYSCDLCNYKCKVKKYLAVHVKKVHTVPTQNPCPVCGKCFHFPNKLRNHMRVHTGEKPNKCKVCGKTFSAKYCLNMHMKIHTGEKDYKCAFCDYACRDNSTIRKHQERHMGTHKSYECGICKKVLKERTSLKRHIDEIHFGLNNRNFPCDQCDKIFKTRGSLAIHIKTIHEKSYKTKCEICSRKVSTGNLKKHLRTHVNIKPYKCAYKHCTRRFREKGDLKKHTLIHYPSKQYRCGICGRKFARKSRLNAHTAQHLPDSNSVQCDYCLKIYGSKMMIGRHIKSKHGVNSKQYTCDTCNVTVYSKRGIIAHLQYGHGTSNETKCKICLKTCEDNSTLKTHYLSKHNVKYVLLDAIKQPTDCRVQIKQEFVDEEDNLMDFTYEVEVHKQELEELLNFTEIKIEQLPRSHETTQENIETTQDFSETSQDNLETSQEHLQATQENLEATHENLEITQENLEVTQETLEATQEYFESIQEHQDSDSENDYSKYSRRVMSEDIHRSIVYGEQDVFDQFFAENMMGKPDEEINIPIADESKKLKVEQRLEKLLTRVRKKNEWKFLLKLRKSYNERIKSACRVKENTKAPKPIIKYYKKPTDNTTSNCNENTEEIEDNISENDNIHNTDGEITSNANKDIANSKSKPVTILNNNEMAVRNDSDESENYQLNLENTVNQMNNITVLSNEDSDIYDKNSDTTAEIMNNTNRNDEGDIQGKTIGSNDTEVSNNTVNSNNMNSTNCNNSDLNNPKEMIEENDVNYEEIQTRTRKNNINNKESKDDDDEVEIGDDDDSKDSDYEGDGGKQINVNGRVTFNMHQCYICFQLYKTKSDLKRHSQEHFDLCNEKMLKKCPFCGYVTNKNITKHIKIKHDIDITISYAQIKEKHNNSGSKYVYEIQQNCDLEIIPSISNLNKMASVKIDRQNRENKNTFLGKTKLVKRGKEWIVEKQAVKVNVDNLLPEFTKEEYLSVTNDGNNYVDRLKSLSVLAKKRGVKMLYPCVGCEKICLNLAALRLHNRKHEDNPKPFKPKVWKNGKYKTRNKKISNKQVADTNVNLNKKNSIFKTNRLELIKEDDNKNDEEVIVNRFAEPQPVKNKHKCDKELIEFYKNNIKGKDIEFWQFLKIFNKMTRENVSDFKDLEERTDFGFHKHSKLDEAGTSSNKNNDDDENYNHSNTTDEVNDEATNNIDNTINSSTASKLNAISKEKTKMNVNSSMNRKSGKVKKKYTRVVMISKREYLQRQEIKEQMRRRIEESRSQ